MNFLKFLRLHNGLSIKELAKHTLVNPRTIIKIEKGQKVNRRILREISEYFLVSSDELTSEIEPNIMMFTKKSSNF